MNKSVRYKAGITLYYISMACIFLLLVKEFWGVIEGGFVGGEYFSWVLVWFEWEPWVLTVVILIAFSSAFMMGAIRQKFPIILRCVFLVFTSLLVFIAGAAAVYGNWIKLEEKEHKNAFVVAEYKNFHPNRHLIFLGEMHLSKLSSYKAMKDYLTGVGNNGYEVYYEGTDAISVCKGLKIDLQKYGVHWWRYYIDTLRSPRLWPWFKGKSTNVDIFKDDDEVKVIGRAKFGDDCFNELNKARDRHLYKQVVAQSAPEKLIVYYGSGHWKALDGALLNDGWSVIGEPVWSSTWLPPFADSDQPESNSTSPE